MARVFYLHWNKAEALVKVRALRAAGHTVSYHYTAGERACVGEVPDIWVISLERLPSHGRAVAEWCHETRQRRAIPLLFVGGAADKVARTRAKFPNASFCQPQELEATIDRLVPAARRPRVTRAACRRAQRPTSGARPRGGARLQSPR